MRKITAIIICIIIAGTFVIPVFSADNPEVVEAFRKNFTRGSLSTKVRVLQDSLEYEDVDMSPLYLLSLDFIINNAWMLQNDTIGRDLMFFTIRLLGTKAITGAADNLWKFFALADDSDVRVEIMNALGDTAAGKAGNYLRNKRMAS